MEFRRREIRVLLVVGILIGVVAAPVVAALLNGVPTSGTVPLESNTGPTVYVQGATNMTLETPFVDANTINVTTDQGTAIVSATGPSSAYLASADLEGTYTIATQIDANGSSLTINPGDKEPITVSGDLNRIEFTSMELNDGDVDFVYAGTSGSTTVVARGLPAGAQILAIDQATGETLESGTTNATGAVTLSSMPNSEHSVLLKEPTDGAPRMSDPIPEGNISTPPSNLSVYLSDENFPGQTVTVEFYYEGSKIDTVNVTQEGRVNTTALPPISAGQHEWSAVATDELGKTDVVNVTFGTPGTLYIRNETQPSQLVTNPVNVTVSFFNETAIKTFTISDGTLDMTGLPTEDFIVRAEPSGTNYTARTIHFQNIIGNKSVYLLNTSVTTTVESRFVLDDPTGQFGSESLLIIKKPIEQDNTTTYQTIFSDEFGAEGVTATLEEGVRYRLTIRSEDGDVQSIGPYRAEASETVTVRPGSPTLPLPSGGASWIANSSLDNRTLSVAYNDSEGQTQQVTVFIHERGNKSNQLRPNSTYYDLGTFASTYTLSENESQVPWTVEYVITRDDREFVVEQIVQNRPNIVLPELSQEWRIISGISALLLLAGAFSVLNVGAGAIALSVGGGVLWYVGWLSGATSAGSITIYMFIAVIYKLRMR